MLLTPDTSIYNTRMADAPSKKEVRVTRITADQHSSIDDCVAVEEPLEIRVIFGSSSQRTMRSLSIVMRTPGHDRELAAGFLFTESIISSPDQIDSIQFRGVTESGEETGNIVRVDLRPEVKLDWSKLQRNFFTTSSCGVCGKASLEALSVQGLSPLTNETNSISPDVIRRLPAQLRGNQPTFAKTGGLHAAGLFDTSGQLLSVHEDVGRHNAVDKLIGQMFLAAATPLDRHILVLSGRASFEIMQKALVAQIQVVVAVGAPSSLAIELAEPYNMTLIGFASADRFNIYSAASRVSTA